MTSARDKTLQHMRRLASLAAAGVAMAGPACSSGYGVVDPLPPPPKCGDVAKTITATAVVREVDGSLRVEITLGKSTRADVAFAKDPPTGSSTTVISSTPSADGGLVVVLAPIPPGSVYVSVPLDCPAGRAHVEAYVTIPAGVVAGASVKVTLADGY